MNDAVIHTLSRRVLLENSAMMTGGLVIGADRTLHEKQHFSNDCGSFPLRLLGLGCDGVITPTTKLQAGMTNHAINTTPREAIIKWSGSLWSLVEMPVYSEGCHSNRRAMMRVVLIAMLIFMTSSVAAQTQDAKGIDRAPSLTIERYQEDWSYLADPATQTGYWTEDFKYIPLSRGGPSYLSIGMEMRLRYENFENTNWGDLPDDNYVWHRWMPYADLHLGKLRLFAQAVLSGISGNDRTPSPVDTTGADLLQAFVETETTFGARTSLQFSAGRKLVTLGAGRFVDARYGPNVMRAFEGGDATLTGQNHQVTALHFRPVDNGPGDFDDRASRRKEIWGLYATKWMQANRSTGVDLYYLGLRDSDATFDQGAGKQKIHTFGTRVFGDTGAWRWNIEGALQRGTFADNRVAAWRAAADIGHRFSQLPFRPELGLSLDISSGDDNSDDSKLGTMNPLFPSGKYFGDNSPIGPQNLIHLRPSVTIHPRDDLAISFSGGGFWRESTKDGIYAMSGNLIRSGGDSTARSVGKKIEVGVSWQATKDLNLSATVSRFAPGAFIKETGASKALTTLAITANFRF